MKKIIIPLLIILAIVFVFSLNNCSDGRKGTEDVKVVFSGRITNSQGIPLDSVKVELQGGYIFTDKEGNFKIGAKRDTLRFVLNATRNGYGFVSKIYSQAQANIKISMARATEKQIDIRRIEGEVIRVVDRNPEMTTPPGANVATANPLSSIPFVYNATGQLIDFKMPAAIENNYQAMNNFRPPVVGAQVEIPKNGLELNGDNTLIDVSIQTIDLYSGDGMPGNNTVRLGNSYSGFIKSFGAMNFDITQNGKPVKLKKGIKARITIPVDTISILTKESLNPTIPFLTYNRSTGIWEQEGTAILNKSKSAYEGWTTHFSTFNMDMTFGSGSTCYKICNTLSSTTYPDQKIEISAPYYHFFNMGTAVCECSPGVGAHAIINMGPFSPCGVRVFNGTTLLSTYAFIAGDAASLGACPYDGCGGSVDITDVLHQEYVSSNKLGMCHIQLAFPQRTTSGANSSYPIRLTWLYEQTFSATTTGVRFKIESSTDNATWNAVTNGISYTSTSELVHHFDTDSVSASSTTYYRISLVTGGDGNPSNTVCITIDTFGNIDTSSCTGTTVLFTPPPCF